MGSLRWREILQRRGDVTLDFRRLATWAGARPFDDVGGEFWPHKLLRDQPLRGLDARVREVVQDVVDCPPEVCWDEGAQSARRFVAKERRRIVSVDFDEAKAGGGVSTDGDGFGVALLRARDCVEIDTRDGCVGESGGASSTGARERASATTLSFPAISRISVVYSEMFDSWVVWRLLCGSVFFFIDGTNASWSVYSEKARPSIRYRKWRVARCAPSSSRSKAGNFISVGVLNFRLKKPSGCHMPPTCCSSFAPTANWEASTVRASGAK